MATYILVKNRQSTSYHLTLSSGVIDPFRISGKASSILVAEFWRRSHGIKRCDRQTDGWTPLQQLRHGICITSCADGP